MSPSQIMGMQSMFKSLRQSGRIKMCNADQCGKVVCVSFA